MTRARAGDDRAFEALLTRHARRALVVAQAVLGDADAAEDACQDALFRVWQRLADCRDPERFGAWMARAVHRHALNALRAGRASEDLSSADLWARAPAPDREAEMADLRARLERALRTLSPEQRQVVLLYDLEGWSHAEIADVIGTTAAMSRQHLMLGRRRLREALGPEREP